MTGKNMKKKISENLIHDGSEKGAVTEMTYGGLLREAEQYLEWCGIEENRTDAWYLFSDCFSMDRASYFLRAASAVPEEETEAAVRFRNLLEQPGMPAAHSAVANYSDIHDPSHFCFLRKK